MYRRIRRRKTRRLEDARFDRDRVFYDHSRMTGSPFADMPPPPPEPRALKALPRGGVLAFVPHPDDEIAGPGGALCMHRRQGDPVRVLVATDGRAGDPDGNHEPEEFVQIRREETRAGLAEIGVHDVHYWGFPDGHVLSERDLELALEKAVSALTTTRPDVVYLPWEFEGHADHHALYHVVVRALADVDFGGVALGYEVWNAMLPDVVLDVSEVMEDKLAAMRRYTSQLAYARFDNCVTGLNMYRSLVHGAGEGHWEAYRLVRGELPPARACPPHSL